MRQEDPGPPRSLLGTWSCGWEPGPAAGDIYAQSVGRSQVRVGVGPGTFSKSLGILVVPWQHLLCLSQAHQGSRSQYASLPHASTQGFAEAPGFFNEVLGSPKQSPHWCTEALREERRDGPIFTAFPRGGEVGVLPRARRSGRLWEPWSSGI